MLPGPGPSDDAVRELARRIMERPEYASWHMGRFGDVFAWFVQLFARNPFLFWIIVTALTTLLLVIVVHVAWTLRKGFASRPDALGTGGESDALRFADEAEALAGRGRFLDAARAMQLGAIDRLVRAGHLRLGRGDPNSVLRRRVREAAIADGVRQELVAAIGELERRWFRDRDEDEGLYRRWQRVHAALDTTLTAA